MNSLTFKTILNPVMIYLYLDESGDLGFDFVNKKPSKFFTVTILVIKDDHKRLMLAVKKTLRRKLNYSRKKKRHISELKATGTTLEIKRYFYEQIVNLDFQLYSVTLNKRRLFEELANDKSRVYNFIAKQVVDKIPFEEMDSRVQFILDKSKSKPEIENFNRYITSQLQGRIHPTVPFDIYHWQSTQSSIIQAVDLFCWGIFRVYERNDYEWFDIFKDKVELNAIYLPNKK